LAEILFFEKNYLPPDPIASFFFAVRKGFMHLANGIRQYVHFNQSHLNKTIQLFSQVLNQPETLANAQCLLGWFIELELPAKPYVKMVVDRQLYQFFDLDPPPLSYDMIHLLETIRAQYNDIQPVLHDLLPTVLSHFVQGINDRNRPLLLDIIRACRSYFAEDESLIEQIWTLYYQHWYAILSMASKSHQIVLEYYTTIQFPNIPHSNVWFMFEFALENLQDALLRMDVYLSSINPPVDKNFGPSILSILETHLPSMLHYPLHVCNAIRTTWQYFKPSNETTLKFIDIAMKDKNNGTLISGVLLSQLVFSFSNYGTMTLTNDTIMLLRQLMRRYHIKRSSVLMEKFMDELNDLLEGSRYRDAITQQIT
jgi:hypothetical protein